MFTAKVYSTMVGSLSDTMEDVYVAKETIRKWNQNNAERVGKLFLPVEWSANLEEIQGVDVVICIVGNWIGDIGFVERCIEDGKQVMLFFNSNQDPTNTIMSEYNAVMNFHDKMRRHCLCVGFKEASELCQELSLRLKAIL